MREKETETEKDRDTERHRERDRERESDLFAEVLIEWHPGTGHQSSVLSLAFELHEPIYFFLS